MDLIDSTQTSRRRFDTLEGALTALGLGGDSSSPQPSRITYITSRAIGPVICVNADLTYAISSYYKDELGARNMCLDCRGINAKALCSKEGYAHVKSITELTDPAHEKCILCEYMNRIVTRIPATKKTELLKAGSQLRMTLVKEGKMAGLLASAISLHVGELDIPGPFAKFYVRCHEGDPAATYGISTVKKLDYIGGPKSMATAKTWYQECLAQHDCSTYFPLIKSFQGVLPDRLVHISYKTPTEPAILKLVKTEQLSPQVFPYATLSHCWGTSQNKGYLLTKANESDRYKGIRFDCIPKTFRDAIFICTSLGLDYLWIDSLCIVQDSPNDWLKEAGKMGAIYANSAITIAADSARDSSEGCFNQKSTTQLEELESVVSVTNNLTNTQEDSTLFIAPFDIGTGKSIPAIENENLSTRAWTYQERFLPPRILHCTQRRMYWECRKCFHAEDDIIDWQPSQARTVPSFVKNQETFQIPLPADPSPEMQEELLQLQLIHMWYEVVVKNYSGRNLTRGSDKLVAISGVARAIGGMLAAEYLFGFWNMGIMEAIIFTRDTRMKPGPRSERFKNQCPSWTWAGHDFPVQWLRGVLERKCWEMSRFAGGELKPIDGGDRYGQMNMGHVRFHARLRKLKLRRQPPHPFGQDSELETWLVNSDNIPVGSCTLDYIEPDGLEVRAMLCVVDGTENSFLGHVLLLKQMFDCVYERVGCGKVGGNVVGAGHMPEVPRTAAEWLADTVKIDQLSSVILF